MRSTGFLFAVLALVACGGGGGDDDDVGGSPDAAGGDPVDAGPDEDGFVPIVTVDWEVPPPDGDPTPDKYFCARLTLEEGRLLGGFRAISPVGTHHTVLSVGPSSGPDGEFECAFFQNHDSLLFASGVGTDDFLFPEGVALPIEAGQQLFLNVHTFNTGDETISGTSGVSALYVDDAEQTAEFTLAGTFDIDIPQDSTGHQESGTCPVDVAGTILNWWPHMHQLGRRMTLELNNEEIFDEPFIFTEQINYPRNIAIAQGDQLRVTCTFDGSPDQDVGFGDSSNQEMCFVGYYRYPAIGQPFCATGSPF